MDTIIHNGGSVLTAVCANEDADVDVLRYVLKHGSSNLINKRQSATTMKWYLIQQVAKLARRTGLAGSGVFHLLSSEAGATA